MSVEPIQLVHSTWPCCQCHRAGTVHHRRLCSIGSWKSPWYTSNGHPLKDGTSNQVHTGKSFHSRLLAQSQHQPLL